MSDESPIVFTESCCAKVADLIAEENPEKSEQATDRAETFRAPIQQEAARKIIRNFDRVQADAAETRRQAEQQISEDK